ncbi:hypothetical protein F4561_005989 [Lipingzhangella halophila]|uniref:DUF397 domain-containing protein n=2 Tax=Lipingzhangella halophila TaxID=1783352 RepID=A0A7W7RN87_9ACTN|nr:DUF397 domain-containing protein [Lipingzhangella halophila]MBB4935095.1 hypothetical protein [Lipingzhangella halophila]
MELRDGRLVGHEEYLSGVNVVSGPKVNKLVELFGNLQGEALSTHASVELTDTIRKELRQWRIGTSPATAAAGTPDCLECRTTRDQVQVRDTQHRDHGHLGFPLAEWRAFLAQVRRDTV